MQRRGWASDEANTLVLEAIVIAVLLMVAVIIPTMQPPPARNEAASRIGLEQAAEDLLGHFATSADPSLVYPSALDRIVAEALQGNHSYLAARVDRTLPPGVVFNALLDNGAAQRRLLWERASDGEAVSAARLWSPGWETILAAPRIGLVPDDRGALDVQAVPIHRATGFLDQPGVRAEVELELPGGIVVNRTVFAPLLNRSAAGPGLSLALVDPAGARSSVVAPGSGNDTLVLSVEETQGRAVPAGSVLQVLLPPGVTGVAINASRNPDWTDRVVTGNSSFGWVAQAELAADLLGAEVRFEVNATLPSTAPLLGVQAKVEDGTYGDFHGVLRNATATPAHPAAAPGLAPRLSLPGLAPWSAAADGWLAVPYPENATAREVTVKRVTLQAKGGAALLAASGTTPAAGWAFAGGEMEWTGARALAGNEALDFAFTLQADAPSPGDPGGLDGLGADLRFRGYAMNSTLQDAPGLWVARVGPRVAGGTEGYDPAAGAKEATLTLTREGAALEGELAYEVSTNDLVQATFPDLARGAQESWLAVDTPRVPLGGTATVRWDVRRAVEELGVQAAQFKCYTSDQGAWTWTATRAACDPETPLAWQFLAEEPAVSLRVYHPSPVGPDGAWPLAQEVTGLGQQGSRDLALPTSSLLGTHVVELRVAFAAEPFAGTGALTQEVRLLGAFDVHREGRAPGLPAYSVILQAWLPDWG